MQHLLYFFLCKYLKVSYNHLNLDSFPSFAREGVSGLRGMASRSVVDKRRQKKFISSSNPRTKIFIFGVWTCRRVVWPLFLSTWTTRDL
uniref:Uncharacterized protein n=1 Tax=Daucus carota subsp. sativus TaxID=79200 RepID=A0A175YL92_DAUCS